MPSSSQHRVDRAGGRHLALRLILLLGVVSALGDITYESARSVSGPFFLSLGASAAVIGFVSGLGEFLGYGLRLLFGVLADRLRAYWSATVIGYGLLLSLPLLAFVHSWEAAALLLILERIGKAIRSPSRDTILSYATHHTGRGWGFAFHEALDQVGAVIGPLIFAAAFISGNAYRIGFSLLWIPAILTMVMLVVAWVSVPRPQELEGTARAGGPVQGAHGMPRVFWLYAAFTFMSVAGFASFQIISYHWAKKELVPTAEVPVLYAVAMGVDALVALAAGKAYDRIGLKVLAAVPVVTAIIPFVAFASSHTLVVLGAVLWGAVMALHETIMRAAIADVTEPDRRATAYGTFNVVYGAAWFAGSSCLGWLYDSSLAWVGAFVVVVELVAVVVFVAMERLSLRVPGRLM